MDTGSVHEIEGIPEDASTGRFDRRLNDLSSWSAARKSLLVSGVVLFLCLYAMILLQFARLNPEVVPFISRTGLEYQIELSFLTIAAWVLLRFSFPADSPIRDFSGTLRSRSLPSATRPLAISTASLPIPTLS